MIWSSLQDRSVSWLEDVRGRTFVAFLLWASARTVSSGSLWVRFGAVM